MPFTNIFMRMGKGEAYCAAVLESVSLALSETLDVPEDYRHMTITEQDEQCLLFWQKYLGFERADEPVIIQITDDDGHAGDHKAALFRSILVRLSTRSGIDPRNVFISLIQVAKEDWPFGNSVAR